MKCKLCDQEFTEGRSQFLCDSCFNPTITEEETEEMAIKVCAYDGCTNEFIPTGNRQRFCDEHKNPNKAKSNRDEHKTDTKKAKSNDVFSVFLKEIKTEDIQNMSIRLTSGITIEISR